MGSITAGDITPMQPRPDFPLRIGDNWALASDHESLFPSEINTMGPFGEMIITLNDRPLISKTVWVLGDSFTNKLRPFLSATFEEVRFMGHWGHGNILKLADQLSKQETAIPDFIIVTRVERSF